MSENLPSSEERRAVEARPLGAILVVLGVLFLLGQFIDLTQLGLDWPFYIIVPGVLVLLVSLFLPVGTGEGFAALGGIITTIGLILLYQESTGRWESWAYAWALIAPTSVGVTHMLYGLVRGQGKLVIDGVRTTIVGLIIFAVAALLFGRFTGMTVFPLVDNAFFLPLLLIGAGILLLLSTLFARGKA